MQAPSKAPTTAVKPKFLLVTLGGRKDGRDHLMQVEMCASSGMQASEDARNDARRCHGQRAMARTSTGRQGHEPRIYIYIYAAVASETRSDNA